MTKIPAPAMLFAAILLFTPAAQATDYYVSVSGNNSNPGTSPKNAWKSIEKVNSVQFKAGDNIFFEGGKTFEGSLRFDADDSGKPQNPVTVGSFGNGRATISSACQHGLYAENCGGFVVKDLILVGAGRDVKDDFSGVYFSTDLGKGVKPEYIRIDNVQVSGYRQRGIHISGSRRSDSGFKDVRITNADVHDNGNQGIAASGSKPPGDWVHKGIYVGNCKVYDNAGIAGGRGHSGNGIILSSVDGAVIEYCTAYNNGEFSDDPNSGGPIGIWAWDSKNVVIQYCEAYDNKTGNRADGGGFDLDGGCVNCVVQYNYSHGNDGAGYGIYQYGGAREFKNNVVRYNISEADGIKNRYGGINFWSTNSSGGIQNTRVYNNTIYISNETKGAAIADLPASDSQKTCYVYGTEIYNNIFLAAPGKRIVDIPNPQSGWSFRSNCYWTYGGDIEIRWGDSTYNSLNEWRVASGQERFGGVDVGFKTDPKLIDPGAARTIGNPRLLSTLNAYKLTPSSPLINAGIDIKSAFGIDAGKQDYYGTKIPCSGKYDVGAHEFDKAETSQVRLCWWKFDQGTGKVAANSGSLGNSADGTLNNMDDGAWVDGISGKALEFDGEDDDVSIGPLNLNSNTVTISAWIKRNGWQDVYAGIVYSRDGDTIAGIGSGSTGEPDWQGNHELFYTWNDTEDTWAWHSGLIIPDSQWVFVALVLEPTRATLYLGKDGKLTRATNTVNHATEEFNGVTRIGHDKKPDFPPRFFKGFVDDVRIYDRALSPTEIAKLAKPSE
jgi:hypothetical protein